MAIQAISNETKEALKRKSALGLPDSPTASGYTPAQIKAALVRAILGDSNSIVTEINRIVTEANADIAAEGTAVIGTDRLASGAVTQEKLSSAVISAINAVIGTDRLASGAVTQEKLSAAVIEAINATIGTQRMADGAVTEEKLASALASKINGAAGGFHSATYNQANGVITFKDEGGDTVGTVDLPLEQLIVSGTYNEVTKDIDLTLSDGSVISVPLDDLAEKIHNGAIHSSGAPTSSTEADYIGQLYVNDTTGKIYFCEKITSGAYTWRFLLDADDFPNDFVRLGDDSETPGELTPVPEDADTLGGRTPFQVTEGDSMELIETVTISEEAEIIALSGMSLLAMRAEIELPNGGERMINVYSVDSSGKTRSWGNIFAKESGTGYNTAGSYGFVEVFRRYGFWHAESVGIIEYSADKSATKREWIYRGTGNRSENENIISVLFEVVGGGTLPIGTVARVYGLEA